MLIVDLAEESDIVVESAAQLLVTGFEAPAGWLNLEVARQDTDYVLENGFARAAIANGVLVGWIGGLPEYEGRVWELHPIVVRKEFRRQGIGRKLVQVFEQEARIRGAVTATLGTDDNEFMTTLAGANLYDDLPRRLKDLRDLGREHPFAFYQKLGYVVTGVVPDANGPGRPDILMSKRIG